MFLLEPGHTAYDLHFHVFGISVRVHPVFWLLSAIMGFSLLQVGFPPFLVWMACVFFSILIHELGHVFMFRACGADAHVVLYAFGGLAIPDRYLHNRWQRIAVGFAGPLAQFLIIAAIAAVLALTGVDRLQFVLNYVLGTFGIRTEAVGFLDFDPLVDDAIEFLLWINLFWALLNLLPIFPLDGGQISRDFLDGLMPGGQGKRMALGISLVLAAILAVHCIAASAGTPLIPFLAALRGSYPALLFGLLAFGSFQMLQQQSNPPWRREE